MLDRERLAKILALTASTNDGEALAAIRKANDIVRGEDMTWDDVLVQLVPAVSNVHVTVHRNSFVTPEFHEAMEAWHLQNRR
jgi:hypothetical protein